MRRDLGVVHRAEVVLERDDPRDERRRLGPERLAHELERVAQALGLDPELVEGRDVGPLEDRLVGPDVLVGQPDPRAGGVADAVRAGRIDRSDGRARGHHEVAVVLDEPSIARPSRARWMSSRRPASRCSRHVARSGSRPSRSAAGQGRRRRPRSPRSARPGRGPCRAGRPRVRSRRRNFAVRSGRKPSPKTRQAARIRRVDTRIAWSSSGSSPFAGPGLAGDHPGEVEAEDLATGLGMEVVGGDPGRLADRDLADRRRRRRRARARSTRRPRPPR